MSTMSNRNILKLMYWNSRSLNNKAEEFFHFAESHDIDVAVATETWLRSHNSIYRPNYTTVRLDRQHTDADRGDGVAIFVRRNIAFSQLELSTSIVEAVRISVVSASTPVNIVAAYYPGSNKRADLQHFRRDIRTLTSFAVTFFTVGDFNSRHTMWNCATSNKAGKILVQEYESLNFYIHHPDAPTRYPPGRGRSSTLDHTLSNNVIQMSVPEVTPISRLAIFRLHLVSTSPSLPQQEAIPSAVTTVLTGIFLSEQSTNASTSTLH